MNMNKLPVTASYLQRSFTLTSEKMPIPIIMNRVFDAATAHIVRVSHRISDPHWHCAQHTHDYWEFVYYLRGHGRIELPHGTFFSKQYHFSIYPPGMPHEEATDPSDPEEILSTGIDVTGVLPKDAPLMLPDPQGLVRSIFEWLITEMDSRGNTPLVESYIQSFLHLIERAWEKDSSVEYDPVDFAIHYLNTNYDKEITIPSLAKVTNISRSHLARLFTLRLGISPVRYLQQLRIEKGKRLLITTTQHIGEIAAQIGLQDAAYFGRVFKENVGLSPTEFRARYQLPENYPPPEAITALSVITNLPHQPVIR